MPSIDPSESGAACRRDGVAGPPCRNRPSRSGLVLAVTLAIALATEVSAKNIPPPRNDFSPVEDVELGRDAATEVRRQIAVLGDPLVNEFIQECARRLVEAIPPSLRQTAFLYSFDIMNVTEIASFALPGGPVFISHGMIQTVRSEGELAGVIAHELSHVALRHGTAQVTAGSTFQIGAITGMDIGAVITRSSGHGILAQGSSFAASSYFLKYGYEFERQADRLATQMMAGAGYDPRDLVSLRETIQGAGAGRGGPRWLRSHPNPNVLDDEPSRDKLFRGAAGRLPVDGPQTPSQQFDVMQARIRAMPVDKARHRDGAFPVGTAGGFGVAPSGESRIMAAGDSLMLSVPANWNRVPASNTVTFAPKGAFLNTLRGAMGVTHGVQVGIARSLTGDLQADTQALLQTFSHTNPHLVWTPPFQRTSMAGRTGLTITFSNVSERTGDFEQVSLVTVHLPGGSFLYLIGLSPLDEAGIYRNAFNHVRESVQIVNRP